jgi:hypothetical protein
MLRASIGVPQNRSTSRQSPTKSSPLVRHRRERSMQMQAMVAAGTVTILPLPQLHLEVRIQDIRLHLPLLPHGPSPRTLTLRPTRSNPLEGSMQASPRRMLTQPRARRIHTVAPRRLPLASMFPLQGILDTSTNNIWSIAKPHSVTPAPGYYIASDGRRK